MTESSTPTYEGSSDHFNGIWFMIYFCGILVIMVGGVFYIWYRLIREGSHEEHNNIDMQNDCDDRIGRNREERINSLSFYRAC